MWTPKTQSATPTDELLVLVGEHVLRHVLGLSSLPLQVEIDVGLVLDPPQRGIDFLRLKDVRVFFQHLKIVFHLRRIGRRSRLGNVLGPLRSGLRLELAERLVLVAGGEKI